MRKDFVQASDNHFTLNGKKLLLRGYALGTWMNFEHFMMGMPGTNSMIIDAFREVYGEENAKELVKSILRNMVDDEDIAFLKSLGINSIRIPFGYHYFMDDDNPYVFKEEGFQELDRVVQLCAKHELYVILDMHSTPGSQNTDWHSDNITGQPLFWKYRCFQDQVVWIWKEIAKRYADNQWIIGYDVINEPGYGLTESQINGFYERAIAGIREVDKDHILFLEGIDFGRDFRPLKEFEDEQIAYTVHFYPFVLEDNILDPKMDDARRMEIFTSIFDRQLGEVKRFGKPVWCGESGYEILDGQQEFYSMLLLHNIDICESRDISWNLWTYKDSRCMGIVIPEYESDWMRLFRRIGKEWTHHREEKCSMEATKRLGTDYYKSLSDELAYDLDFRVRSVLHRIAAEQVLKPVLRSIAWEEMKQYPNSFRFDACDKRETVIDNIKNYITQKEEAKL